MMGLAREEIVKTLAAVFVLQHQKWDDRHYPYWSDVSIWEDQLQAFEAQQELPTKQDRLQIILRHIVVLNNGRVMNNTIKTVWKGGVWVSGEHDPRASDPQFREYLRLKEIYES